MTEKNAVELVMVIVRAYPNAARYDSIEAIDDTVALWASQFAEDPAELVALAVKQHIQTSKWPPSIAEIRELMAQATNPDLLPPDQAWLLVSDLMAVHGEYGSEAALASMPEMIRRAVESIGWKALVELHRQAYLGGRPGLDRVAFLDQYKPAFERERTRAQLSPSLRRQIEAIEDRAAGMSVATLKNALEARREHEELFRQIALGKFQKIETETTEQPLLEINNGQDPGKKEEANGEKAARQQQR